MLANGDRNRLEVDVLHKGISNPLSAPIVSCKVIFKTIFVVTEEETFSKEAGAAEGDAVGEIGAGRSILIIPINLRVDLNTATDLGLEVTILRSEFEAFFIKADIALILLSIDIDHLDATDLAAVGTDWGTAKIFSLILGDRAIFSKDINQFIAAELAAGFTEGGELFLVDDAVFQEGLKESAIL